MKPTPFDVTLFRWIESQTSMEDRQALLSLQDTVASAGNNRYLEVGSHLGGSLQPHVIDPRCKAIFSIDPRPCEQPDERFVTTYKYEGNSTARMLSLLATIPTANTSLIRTFEASSWDLAPSDIPQTVDLAFIDGEHTNTAVKRDFESVRRFLSADSILAFHDCYVTPRALLDIAKGMDCEKGFRECIYFPKSNVVAIVFGSEKLAAKLMKDGWQRGFPMTQRDILKLYLNRHCPRLVSALRKLRVS